MSDIVYLDHSATSYPKPPEVYDFMNNFYRAHGVSPGRSGFDAALETEELVSETRKLLCNLFHANDPNHLVFTYNASDALNMVILGTLNPGDHVVTTLLEHNSVLRPLYHLRTEKNVDVTYVPFDEKGLVDPDEIDKAIRKETRMVIVNHTSNVLGTIQPIEEIGKICRKHGVLFVVDASQSAGSIEVDAEKASIDAVCFTGHKGLMGPTGIGGMWVRPGFPVRSTRFGGTGVRSAQESHLEEFPYRLECGTLNILGVAGLYAGVKWIFKQGLDNIHKQELALWQRLYEGLSEIDGVTIYAAEPKSYRTPVLSFNVYGFDAADAGTFLDVDYNIACRTGLHCAPKVHQHIGTFSINGTVRFSIGPFNNQEHIDHAIQAVREIAAIRKG